jgi:uncharacterized membrane protein
MAATSTTAGGGTLDDSPRDADNRTMLAAFDHLVAATALFVGGHFLLASAPLRVPLVRRLGERGFTIAYSLIAVASFVWIIEAYRAAPWIAVWTPAPAFFWVPVIVLPFALLFAIAGLTGPSPTLPAASDGMWEGRDPTAGIVRITRHPFLVGVALWAGSHLLVRGDAASIVLFGSFLVLALGGMWHIDQKKAARLGAAWGPILLTTSVVPFAAIVAGRTRMDWRGIGWWRPTLALAVYAGAVHLHPSVLARF